MSTESNIAVLDQRQTQTDAVLERLTESIDKISQVSNSLNRMISVHEEKFNFQVQFNQEIDKTIGNIINDNKKTHQELLEKIEHNEEKVLKSIDSIRDDLKQRDDNQSEREEKLIKRITSLENWRFYAIGIATAAGFFMHMLWEYYIKSK